MKTLSCLLLVASVVTGAIGDVSEKVPSITQVVVDNRQLQASGGEEKMEVTSFLCDVDNNKIASTRPLEQFEGAVRVCVQTTRSTRLNNIYILKINSWTFFKKTESDGTVQQKAIDAGVEAKGGGTTIFCDSGSDLCAFETALKDDFYKTDGEVEGVGAIAMQFGNGERRQLQLRLRNNSARHLQDFMGMTSTTMRFLVEDGDYGGSGGDSDKYGFKEHWNDQTPAVQGLYVTAILVAVLLCCCICAGIILWRHCCADVEGQWLQREGEPAPFIFFQTRKPRPPPPAYVSETHSDEELSVPEEHLHLEEEADEEEAPPPPRKKKSTPPPKPKPELLALEDESAVEKRKGKNKKKKKKATPVGNPDDNMVVPYEEDK